VIVPRLRNPNRAKALEIYKEHDGNITNREIANLLGEDEKVIAVWKSRDKWNVVQQSNESCTTNKYNDKKDNKVKAVAEEVNEVLENADLTDRQRLFCLHYIRCFNATKAYQKAYGCDYVVAAVNGPRMLGNARVKEEILRLKQERFNRELLSEADIFQKYMDIAFADITDYVEFGQETVPVMGPFGPIIVKNDETGEKRELKKEINVVRFRKSAEVDGTLITEVKQGKDGASIKLADRMKALQWIADHMDLATEEQRARIDILKAKVQPGDSGETGDDGFLDALNNSAVEDWADEDIADI